MTRTSGVAGYAWIALLHDVAGLSFKATLLLANVLVATWLIVTGALIAGAADSDLGLGGRHTYSQLPVAADDAPGAVCCLLCVAVLSAAVLCAMESSHPAACVHPAPANALKRPSSK